MLCHCLFELLNFISICTATTSDPYIQSCWSCLFLRIYLGFQFVDLGLKTLLLRVKLSSIINEVFVHFFKLVGEHTLNVTLHDCELLS